VLAFLRRAHQGRLEATRLACETKVFLAERGLDLLGEQQTKTKTALEFFSKELAGATPNG
jgi:hypothetical protein